MLSIFKKNSTRNEKLKHISDAGSEKKTRNLQGFIQKLKETGVKGDEEYCKRLLSMLAKEMEIIQGAFYRYNEKVSPPVLQFFAGYACNGEHTKELTFEEGEGLPGQVIKDRKTLKLENVPEGYITVKTGLGEASPDTLLLIPVMKGDKMPGLLELASFHNFSDEDMQFLEGLSEHLAEKFKNEKK